MRVVQPWPASVLSERADTLRLRRRQQLTSSFLNVFSLRLLRTTTMDSTLMASIFITTDGAYANIIDYRLDRPHPSCASSRKLSSSTAA